MPGGPPTSAFASVPLEIKAVPADATFGRIHRKAFPDPLGFEKHPSRLSDPRSRVADRRFGVVYLGSSLKVCFLAEARDLYARGLEAGGLALGPEGFEEYNGHFWGFLETRPYMRARHGLALTLLQLGEEEAAIAHFRAMLKLNPNDNQGIRYLLLCSLLRRDDILALETLLADYPDEWSVYWLYTRALLAYRDDQASAPATLKLLKDAKSANEHVPGILAGTTPGMASRNGYVTMGGADEATDYVRECGPAWRKTVGAVEWLAATTPRVPAKRRASKPAL